MRNKTIKAKVLIATVCIAAFASGVYAQQGGTAGQNPTSTKGAVVKGKAPVNKNLLTVKLPKEQEATLKNGLRVVLLESNHKLPIFSMEMVVMSGGFSDPADMRGLANMTALLMREGTAKHNSRELGEALDTIGASFGANSGVSSFTSNITASGLTDNLDQILDLYAEIIRTPKYPTEEVERYRSRTLDSQPQLRANPGFLAQERLAQAIYGTHPASLTFAPPDAIKKITVADLIRFHDQNYVPDAAEARKTLRRLETRRGKATDTAARSGASRNQDPFNQSSRLSADSVSDWQPVAGAHQSRLCGDARNEPNPGNRTTVAFVSEHSRR